MTSGSTGYFPNFSEFASAPDYHGPWTILGDAHPGDPTRTSFRSQISCVFKHPDKDDLYIALADRWLPQLPEDMPNVYDVVAAMARGESPPVTGSGDRSAMAAGLGENTAIADYVWLPIRFDSGSPIIDWIDEWRVEDFA